MKRENCYNCELICCDMSSEERQQGCRYWRKSEPLAGAKYFMYGAALGTAILAVAIIVLAYIS